MPQQFAAGAQILTKPHILLLGLSFLLLSPRASGQQAPLAQAEILGRLAAGNTPSHIAHLVKTRGVSFSVSQDFLYRVKLAGGEGILAERLLSAEQSGESQPISGTEVPFERLAKCAELIHTGATDLAKKECRVSIVENPKSPWPLLVTARLLQQYDLTGNVMETSEENLEEGRELLRRGATLGANLAVAHQLLGRALDSNETATELEKASWLDPEQLEISETTAQQIPRISYVDGGEEGSDFTDSSNEPARIDPETARRIELEPDLASNHRRLAFLYLQVGNFDQVESEFAEAIRLEPDNPAIRSDLAVYFLSLGWRECRGDGAPRVCSDRSLCDRPTYFACKHTSITWKNPRGHQRIAVSYGSVSRRRGSHRLPRGALLTTKRSKSCHRGTAPIPQGFFADL